MICLTEAAAGTLTSSLAPGRELPAWHAALSAEIAHHLTPAHATLLARPQPTPTGTAWFAEGTVRNRYSDLSAENRRALDLATGAILSDIRRLAESGLAPAVRSAWPALRDIPDAGHLFAVDGRPVLAAWGHTGQGAAVRLARLDDGITWHAIPRAPWHRYAAALGTLALLFLLSGLALPRASVFFIPPLNQCTIVPGQLDEMHAQMQAETRGDELRTLLASLTEEVGRRQLLCPIAQQPPAQPHAALQQGRWNRHDLGMLKAC